MKKFPLLLFLLLFSSICVNAQVTIGSDIPPAEGTLLDLKDQATDAENITASRGLLLPRVKLIAKDNLEPLVQSASDIDKKNLTGVIVYNILEVTGSETIRSMTKGLYMWNGKEWTQVGKTSAPNFFYMPSFDLPLGTIGSTQTVNLYHEYLRQFRYDNTTNPNFINGQGLTAVPNLYAQSDLFYVILDYTPGIISDIQLDAGGKMTYKVDSTTVPANAYINIICVVKE